MRTIFTYDEWESYEHKPIPVGGQRQRHLTVKSAIILYFMMNRILFGRYATNSYWTFQFSRNSFAGVSYVLS